MDPDMSDTSLERSNLPSANDILLETYYSIILPELNESATVPAAAPYREHYDGKPQVDWYLKRRNFPSQVCRAIAAQSRNKKKESSLATLVDEHAIKIQKSRSRIAVTLRMPSHQLEKSAITLRAESEQPKKSAVTLHTISDQPEDPAITLQSALGQSREPAIILQSASEQPKEPIATLRTVSEQPANSAGILQSMPEQLEKATFLPVPLSSVNLQTDDLYTENTPLRRHSFKPVEHTVEELASLGLQPRRSSLRPGVASSESPKASSKRGPGGFRRGSVAMPGITQAKRKLSIMAKRQGETIEDLKETLVAEREDHLQVINKIKHQSEVQLANLQQIYEEKLGEEVEHASANKQLAESLEMVFAKEKEEYLAEISNLKNQLHHLNMQLDQLKPIIREELQCEFRMKEADLNLLHREEIEAALEKQKAELERSKLQEIFHLNEDHEKDLQKVHRTHQAEIILLQDKIEYLDRVIFGFQQLQDELDRAEREKEELEDKCEKLHEELKATRTLQWDMKLKIVTLNNMLRASGESISEKYEKRIQELTMENTDLRRLFREKCNGLMEERMLLDELQAEHVTCRLHSAAQKKIDKRLELRKTKHLALLSLMEEIPSNEVGKARSIAEPKKTEINGNDNRRAGSAPTDKISSAIKKRS